MKKFIIIACFLLVAVNAYAATIGTNGRQPRVWDQAVSSVKLQSGGTDYTDNTTAFTNIAVTGTQATGNAGYIVFNSADAAGNVWDYYLWVDATNTSSTGVLRLASFPLLTSNPSVFTSFPYGDWRNSTGFTSGVAVSTVPCNGGQNASVC